MHTTIKYEGSEDAKQRRAVMDIVNWMGGERFRQVTIDLRKAYKAGALTEEQHRFLLHFAGVQGYPVQAHWDRYMQG